MYRNIFMPADILLPALADMEKWSVIACDQFSSEIEYWEEAERIASRGPSTLHMIVPEAYLGSPEKNSAEQRNSVMDKYLADRVFRSVTDSYIYVEREVSGGLVRRGIVGKLDLDAYEYAPGSSAPVRASERTVADRLPPRMKVRAGAPIELPHVILFFDDAGDTVLGPLSAVKSRLGVEYDFELMQGGGRITGRRVTGDDAERVSVAFGKLAERELFMVVGDGNHSLAAAKGCWDAIKPTLSESERENHPARWALVEAENVYDRAISFEPIHRAVFRTKPEKLVRYLEDVAGGDDFELKCLWSGREKTVKVGGGSLGGMIELVQSALECFVKENGGEIDYIHGDGSCAALASAPGCLGILMPAMEKGELFRTVFSGIVFPKKSFSVGNARDKRYYLECRKIK